MFRSFLNFIFFTMILVICALIGVAIHSYQAGSRHPYVTFVLLLTGLIGSFILVKSPKYNH